MTHLTISTAPPPPHVKIPRCHSVAGKEVWNQMSMSESGERRFGNDLNQGRNSGQGKMHAAACWPGRVEAWEDVV